MPLDEDDAVVWVSPIDGHAHYAEANRAGCAVCGLQMERDRLQKNLAIALRLGRAFRDRYHEERDRLERLQASVDGTHMPRAGDVVTLFDQRYEIEAHVANKTDLPPGRVDVHLVLMEVSDPPERKMCEVCGTPFKRVYKFNGGNPGWFLVHDCDCEDPDIDALVERLTRRRSDP